jgi:aminopeptidase-like protein
MSEELKDLYPYRIFAIGGHVHSVYVPFESIEDFLDEIAVLSNEEKCLFAVYLSKDNNIVEIGIVASCITGVDRPNNTSSIKLEEVKDKIKQSRIRNTTKKQEVRKFSELSYGERKIRRG